MLYSDSIECHTREEFDHAVEIAYGLCLQTDLPMRIMGHCSPTRSGGSGIGGLLFSALTEDEEGSLLEIMLSLRTDFEIEDDLFEINLNIENKLREEGKLIGYSDWERDFVTHIVTIPWNKYPWEYGMVCNDTTAIIALLKYGGSALRRGNRKL